MDIRTLPKPTPGACPQVDFSLCSMERKPSHSLLSIEITNTNLFLVILSQLQLILIYQFLITLICFFFSLSSLHILELFMVYYLMCKNMTLSHCFIFIVVFEGGCNCEKAGAIMFWNWTWNYQICKRAETAWNDCLIDVFELLNFTISWRRPS